MEREQQLSKSHVGVQTQEYSWVTNAVDKGWTEYHLEVMLENRKALEKLYKDNEK